MNSESKTLLEIIKERALLLEKIDNNIEKRELRIAKLKGKNWFITEAAPEYKESYTKK